MKSLATLKHSTFLTLCFILFSGISLQAQSELAHINDSGSVGMTEFKNIKQVDLAVSELTYNALPYLASTAHFNSVEEYIQRYMAYPDVERKRGKNGMVKVQFDIMPDGHLENIVVIDAPSEAFAQSARELVSNMPLWQPAIKANKPVKSRYQLNLNFNLR